MEIQPYFSHSEQRLPHEKDVPECINKCLLVPSPGWQRGEEKAKKTLAFLPDSRQISEIVGCSYRGKFCFGCQSFPIFALNLWGKTRTSDNPLFLFVNYLTSSDSIWVLWLSIEVEIELKPNKSGPISRGPLHHWLGSGSRHTLTVHSQALSDTVIDPVQTSRSPGVRKELLCGFSYGYTMSLEYCFSSYYNYF